MHFASITKNGNVQSFRQFAKGEKPTICTNTWIRRPKRFQWYLLVAFYMPHLEKHTPYITFMFAIICHILRVCCSRFMVNFIIFGENLLPASHDDCKNCLKISFGFGSGSLRVSEEFEFRQVYKQQEMRLINLTFQLFVFVTTIFFLQLDCCYASHFDRLREFLPLNKLPSPLHIFQSSLHLDKTMHCLTTEQKIIKSNQTHPKIMATPPHKSQEVIY